ncbi:hypothetical protein D3OALGA1CA_826 [Olavius algarvensis associated proteobacterium Delta 3]|nr:hypothetical protein D3OALGA1CA_826 [Olavius algarvensis associated proteobacterium Delta 3]CAB5142739.1 hypothetical protein D3OALGB2SA_4329 [Olavius algarvensis associated proteobacterium Delta 3]
MANIIRHMLRFTFIAALFGTWLPPVQASADVFTLQETIEAALEANLDLKISREEVNAAESVRRAEQANFFPKLTANYLYTYHDKERQTFGGSGIVVIQPQDETQFTAVISQPLFKGFSLSNRYEIAKLGLDIATVEESLQRQRIAFAAKDAYYSVLRAQKLVKIAEQAVTGLEANEDVSRNFYDVGMIPLNDLLRAEVELANSRQDLIVAKNQLEVSRANFNTLLRRGTTTPVNLEDVTEFEPFTLSIDECQAEAKQKRPEVTIADFQIQLADREIRLARRNYYPSLDLSGTYFRNESGFLIGAGDAFGFITEPDGWDIQAVASFDFWMWGPTPHGVKEKLSRRKQAEFEQSRAVDNIRLEVKQAYLRTKDSESNIFTVQKAVDQAKENFRITEERYKEQIAVLRDVIDAQTLLTRTLSNYFNAIYDYEISKASLYFAMGRE